MKSYNQLSITELVNMEKELILKFNKLKTENLSLDLSRGKPSAIQLDICNPMLDILSSSSDTHNIDGLDCRNYSTIDGTPEAKQLMADLSNVPIDNILLGGTASLTLMFDIISRSMTHGVCGSTPWCKLEKVKFLCPSPGFDRHFHILDYFGFELITIPVLSTGPDMDLIESLVLNDPSIKGIWCVPMYTNPDGISYSDDTVRRFANLNAAADDFRIFWDNAYAVHHLYKDKQHKILNIFDEANKANQPDIFYQFVSTSKITFAGGGISAVSGSQTNLDEFRKIFSAQFISNDKLNQLRHARFFHDIDGLNRHMMKLADVMRPKFEISLDALDKQLSGLDIGTWTKPVGGYFISFTSITGCAKKIIDTAKEAGLIMTPAGSTFPYGVDPMDNRVRIAPTHASDEELPLALEVLITSIKLVSVQHYLDIQKNKE